MQPELDNTSQEADILDALEEATQEMEAKEAEVQAAEKTYTRDDMRKARRQEKDKLYNELQSLREQVQTLTASLSAIEEEKRQKEQEAADLRRKQEEDEMDVRSLLAKKEVEWQQQLDQERMERERMSALFEQERQFTQLQQYKARRIDEVRDDILPELLDLVTGSTPDEIEASISGLIQRTDRILENAQSASQQIRRETTGARVTSPPTEDPLDNYSGQKQFTPEQIRSMSVEEYSQYRQALLGQGASRGQGIFG